MLVPKITVFFQALVDNFFWFYGDVWIDSDWWDRRAFQNCVVNNPRTLPPKQQRSCCHLVEYDAKRERRMYSVACPTYFRQSWETADSVLTLVNWGGFLECREKPLILALGPDQYQTGRGKDHCRQNYSECQGSSYVQAAFGVQQSRHPQG